MQLPIIIEEMAIHQDAQGRFCLNDLHKASGEEQRHRPKYWLENKQTQELIQELEKGGIPPILTKQGFGTYVCKELVYAYAMWISPRFHILVIRTFDTVMTQALKMTKALTWEQQRQAGKAIRADFTSTLNDHGVTGFGFAQCTNGIYRPLFGATATKLKTQRGLTKKPLCVML